MDIFWNHTLYGGMPLVLGLVKIGVQSPDIVQKPINTNPRLKGIPYLPVYNAHLFSLKLASKIEMRIIHGILCLDPRAI